MIIEFLLGIIFSILNGLLSLIPATPALPNGMVNAIDSVFTLISTVGYFLPLSTLSTVLIIMFAVYNIKVIMDFISWILRKIPTMAG